MTSDDFFCEVVALLRMGMQTKEVVLPDSLSRWRLIDDGDHVELLTTITDGEHCLTLTSKAVRRADDE
jgi:hypothetical protein